MLTRRGFAGVAGMAVTAGFSEFAFAQRANVAGAAPKNTVWLNANEFPDGPPAAAVQAMSRVIGESNRYHYGEFQDFYKAVASIEKLDANQILMGAGSSEPLHDAVDVFTGQVTHHGKHYTVETARLYSRPAQPPPIYVSGFGEQSAELAARIADGYICIGPEADLVKLFRDQGGGSKPVQGGLKGCWAPDAGQARATLRQLWPSDFIPGESAQLLPTPRHFSQLAPLVTDDLVTAPSGPDPKPYLETLSSFEQAGFDEVYLQQVGGNLEGAFEFFATQVLPRARGN